MMTGVGSPCTYLLGSQLTQAIDFLHAHGKFTALVTIDIGANNVDGCISGATLSLTCVYAGFAAATADLPVIMSALKSAAPASTLMVGMNYYDPYLAAWFGESGFGQLTSGSLLLTNNFNALLGSLYGAFSTPVANVQDAFFTNTTTGTPVPTDVAAICAWTWMCSAGNIHANAAGYSVIAGAFEDQIGSTLP